MNKQVAVVTGASQGIGKAIALRLAREGCQVVINYYASEKAQEVSEKNKKDALVVLEEVEKLGSTGIICGADVSDHHSAQNLIEEAAGRLGQIDILVNNAGINKDQILMRISDEDWDQIIKTNLYGAFYCCRAALRLMVRKRYGRIINISSIVGLTGNAGQAHYAASKAGLIGFTYSIAREYGGRGITANIVAPGFIQTSMTEGLTGEQKDRLLAGVAVGRLGTPDDVASAVAYLASPEASYITAQVIRVDGGMY
ncbi:MAG: 3-oxoacyl-[acyl-carrier-protein] reductase [Syntrophomonadaceae bacterium]|jgi:3-oxoacyl-[acyl-carrier protein] reductase